MKISNVYDISDLMYNYSEDLDFQICNGKYGSLIFKNPWIIHEMMTMIDQANNELKGVFHERSPIRDR